MEIIRRCSGFLFGMECLGCGSVSEQLDPWLCPACREELLRESLNYSFPGPDTMCLFPLRPLTRRLVHSLKYRGSREWLRTWYDGLLQFVMAEWRSRLRCWPSPFSLSLSPAQLQVQGARLQSGAENRCGAGGLYGRARMQVACPQEFQGVADQAFAGGARVERGRGIRNEVAARIAGARDGLCRG